MDEEDTDMEENMSGMEDDPNDSDYEEVRYTLKAKKVKRGKWKLYYDNRSFKKEWLDLFPWVEEDPDDPKFAICRACNKKIKAHKGILDTHQKTKKHIKNISGVDDIEDDDEEPIIKSEKPADSKSFNAPPQQQSVDQILNDDQFSFFTESPMDAAHQAITNLIDKLVEKYHDKRVENLRLQNQIMYQLNSERASSVRAENQRKLERHLMQEANKREAMEFQMKFLQEQHETKINRMERERDAKLKAVEQQLMFTRQEYERKVKLLDQQLQSMK